MDSEIPSFEAQQQRVKLDRKSTIFPAQPSQVRRCKLSPFDLRFLSHHYNQRCLHYPKPTIDFQTLVDLLKKSLSENLVYFYPLAGRLASSTTDGVYVDCNDSGVEFVEASAQDLGLEDILNPEIPAFIGQLFPLDGAIDVQGQTLPLLAVQVTKLRNGVSVALTVNHCIVDGHSLWHFIDSWTQICRNGSPTISLLPTHDRFGTETSVNMDLVSFQKGLHKPLPPPLRVKVFQFSRDMICRLKDRANEDSKDKPISSFQALCAHTWQAFIRARRPPANVATTLILSVDCRRRLVPPLPPSYFGNVVGAAHGRTYVGELLGNKLSFAARLVHECIRGFQDGNVRDMVDPSESSKRKFEFGDNDLLVSGSPRFGMYESDFGWGRSVGRSIGLINRVDGLIYADPGEDGEGSVALEIALLPHCMNLLEIDEQFLLQSI